MWTFVVGVDGSPESLHARATAASLGAPLGERLIVVHVKHSLAFADFTGIAAAEINTALEETSALARTAVDAQLESYPGLWEFEERHGDPTQELLRSAADHDADLLIVGHRGHGRWNEAIIGSVAARLTHHSRVSVFIVMPPTRAAPAQREEPLHA